MIDDVLTLESVSVAPVRDEYIEELIELEEEDAESPNERNSNKDVGPLIDALQVFIAFSEDEILRNEVYIRHDVPASILHNLEECIWHLEEYRNGDSRKLKDAIDIASEIDNLILKNALFVLNLTIDKAFKNTNVHEKRKNNIEEMRKNALSLLDTLDRYERIVKPEINNITI